jgi:NitT/TauT family transport system permease protein
VDLLTGQHGSVMVWPYAWATLSASLIGTIIGMALGATAGLLLSNFNFLGAVVRPFLVAANATPRIALIPIIILLFGISATSSAVVAILVVFFIAFFNALMGGRSIAPELIGNARLLGASEWGILREVRLPYVLAWTLAAMPIALTFSVISVVTGEILTGYPGMGRLLSTATNTVDSTLTFAVVFFLAAIGMVTVMISDFLQARILHWWGK